MTPFPKIAAGLLVTGLNFERDGLRFIEQDQYRPAHPLFFGSVELLRCVLTRIADLKYGLLAPKLSRKRSRLRSPATEQTGLGM